MTSRCRHGWKWSLTVALSMPCCSANTPSSTNCGARTARPTPCTPVQFRHNCFYTADMAPVLTAVTDQVYLSQTPLVNWTLVTDDTGVLLIDAGYPGSRTDVLRSLDELGPGQTKFAPSC